MNALGIYGGSFDPIHLGHLVLAETAREELKLEKVIFVPALKSPLKSHAPHISDQDRLALIKLAIGDNPFFAYSEVELERKPPSYTVDTLHYFRQVYPDRELILLMGQDSLHTFTEWFQFRTILRLAKLAIGTRPGVSPSLPVELEAFQLPSPESRGFVYFHNPKMEISSSVVRERLRLGKSVKYWLTPQVLAYIQGHKLYT
ncbi:MAG TPA: nicotinate (nicotinamide) nucleotide adenylyltransferase [Firmicutes bacterium]|jgi:nicotinate-nucleotide adenylyltransferase|nr:nicotinate (nicotinamide) nucleotide adenylyltransferase [Bacillota bacterium]HBR28538.1 nicotinate (nicotinamide) nucleotide adenylyltransferase [Bacillota bacterium]HBR34318.1 nicotinate (nicotinamide) nucleotide adenylyltransferase [Bacillota bacterium]